MPGRVYIFPKHVQQLLMNGSCSPKRFINHTLQLPSLLTFRRGPFKLPQLNWIVTFGSNRSSLSITGGRGGQIVVQALLYDVLLCFGILGNQDIREEQFFFKRIETPGWIEVFTAGLEARITRD